MGLSQGNCDSKCAALAHYTRHSDRSAVQFDEFMHERQADTGAFMCASAAVVDAMEALKHARQFLGGNANAGIAHCQDGLPLRWFQPHFNLALKRELESVAEEVEHDLFPHIAVNIGWFIRHEGRAMNNQSQGSLLAEGPEIAGEFGS